MVEKGDLLGDAERVVPRKDHGPGAEQDALGPRCHVREEDGVVRTERVVPEVVLDRPQRVETELVGQLAQPDLLLDDIAVRYVVPVAPRLEDHLHADSHGPKRRSDS